MSDLVSVIIPTYNPDAGRLNKTLGALSQQTLPLNNWELIIVNNNSPQPITVNLAWHPNSLMVDEPKQGLTHARLKGFSVAKGSVTVLVDDDNILNANYLQQVIDVFKNHPKLGAIGGESAPLFESDPPGWLKEFYSSLAIRNLGDKVVISSWQNEYPNYAPIGAGMALRKEALKAYIEKIETRTNVITDRQGGSLASGGDNDMVLELLKNGWDVGYFPTLKLQHIIPRQRMEVSYLALLEYSSNKSWVKLLHSHDINPWKKIAAPTLPFRKLNAWFTYGVLGNKVNYIKWKGYCGKLDGLAEI